MPLYKLEEFDPNYRETFGGDDIKSLHLYTEGGTEVGAVADALVDKNGRFRYLVIDTSLDSVGKKILLPIGLARINYPAGCAYVDGLSKQQVEHLPEYQENIILDHEFEENVRKVYRSTLGTDTVTSDSETYTYEQEPNLYGLNEQYHQTLRLYEERLIANKHRVKTGEVAVGKHIETEIARVTVPIQKERVVIDRVQPSDRGSMVDADEVKFQEGEVAHIDVYQETPEIHKEAFVREEVRVRKVVERDIVEAQDTIRREELDIDTSGDLNVKENSVEINEPA
ncbi:DUF2382 domain-containing protein [Anabaena sp. UHCC 0451]|uniref:DUF2382 domain-containing protein n=1 Tax=Anabaena sp. UHCC 0451 TaxID=2055235 RepID=UPI002B1EE2E3|nr:DUF2382 domain-containing protein [Anabaena sp. UHCC 0451]MEA5575213.1 DUF2382 domain-containing protein [Anabaena sp. UHCC 0451]